MGGMNLVIHAIVVVTIGLVTSRMLLSYLLYLVVNCYLNNKNELQTCF